MHKGRIILAISILFSLLSCSRDIDAPQYESRTQTYPPMEISSLRSSSTTVLGDADLFFSVWSKSNGDSILLTSAPKVDGEWKLQQSCKITEPVFVSAIYPNNLLRVEESLLLKESDQIPIYIACQDLNEHSKKDLTLDFKLIQGKVFFHFDFSSFSTSSMVDEIRFMPRYSYGWINMQQGVFNRMNTKEYERITIPAPIGKTINELCNGGKIYTHDFLIMPQSQTEMSVWIKIDGVEHYFNVSFLEIKSNTEYNVNVDVFNRHEIVQLTPEEKEKGNSQPIPEIKDIWFTNYEFTSTHQYMQNICNNSGVVMHFWLDSRIDYSEKLDYRLLIRDVNDNVVCRSPIYSGLTIKPYHYDGFSVPFYLSVPSNGKYRYQLLLKGKDGVWYEPEQKDDDQPKDKYFQVHDRQSIFSTALYLSDTSGKMHIGTIADLRYDQPYNSVWELNNYSTQTEEVTLKIYNRRQPFENHSRIKLKDSNTWEDFLGEATFELPPLSPFKAVVPYTITKRHPDVDRYLPYICATITYHNPSNGLEAGKEYPLLSDGDLLYHKTNSMRNPNIFIGQSWINNRGHFKAR